MIFKVKYKIVVMIQYMLTALNVIQDHKKYKYYAIAKIYPKHHRCKINIRFLSI